MKAWLDCFCLVGCGVSIAAAWWVVRRQAQTLQGHLQRLAFRERELRFAAHALMMASRTSPQAVIDAIERSAQLLEPALTSMLFAVIDGDALVIERAQGMHAAHAIGTRIALESASPLALAYRLGHRVVTGDTPLPPLPGEQSYIAIPLVDVGEVIAVIAFSSQSERAILQADALVAVVDLAVTAYQIALDHKANIQSATVDSLTGLLTPRAFRKRLFEEVAEARLQHLTASLLFIDTDNFKACNDTYGHAAGDIVLASIARVLLRQAGPEAIVGRNGGDEFCVLLRTGKATALRRAEAIREELVNYPFEHHLGVIPERPITLSIGVASYPADTSDSAELLARADSAMYHSKRNGRNMVSFVGNDQTLLTLKEALYIPTLSQEAA